MSAVLKVEISI